MAGMKKNMENSWKNAIWFYNEHMKIYETMKIWMYSTHLIYTNVVKRIIDYPLNGLHTTYKNGDLGDGVLLI